MIIEDGIIKQIHERGFYEGFEHNHDYDEPLGRALLEFFKNEGVESVVDFGCGTGDYINLIRQNNIYGIGYDGNPNTKEIYQDGEILDLTQPHDFKDKFTWVMSLEVGEHIPPQYEDTFIQNLHMNNIKGIILSWALIGQSGDGHINEHDNQYIKQKVCGLGYENDVTQETSFRDSATLPWFKETIMVFRRIEQP